MAGDLDIKIEADVKQARRFYRELSDKAIAAATARAINDTLKTLRAEGAREIRKEHPALRIKDIKANMIQKKASRWKLFGRVSTQGRALALSLNKGKDRDAGTWPANAPKRGGVTAKFGKGRQRPVTYHGRKAFVVKSYGAQIFVRRFGEGRRIRRFRAPSLPGVFRARRAFFNQLIAEKWPRSFQSRMRYEIERAAAKVLR